MSGQEHSQAALFEMLVRKQKKHEILLAKLEKKAARLERYRARFAKLEATIAEL